MVAHVSSFQRHLDEAFRTTAIPVHVPLLLGIIICLSHYSINYINNRAQIAWYFARINFNAYLRSLKHIIDDQAFSFSTYNNFFYFEFCLAFFVVVMPSHSSIPCCCFAYDSWHVFFYMKCCFFFSLFSSHARLHTHKSSNNSNNRKIIGHTEQRNKYVKKRHLVLLNADSWIKPILHSHRNSFNAIIKIRFVFSFCFAHSVSLCVLSRCRTILAVVHTWLFYSTIQLFSY